MADDFDFGGGFDFSNPVHVGLLDDTEGALGPGRRRRPGCLGLFLSLALACVLAGMP